MRIKVRKMNERTVRKMKVRVRMRVRNVQMKAMQMQPMRQQVQLRSIGEAAPRLRG